MSEQAWAQEPWQVHKGVIVADDLFPINGDSFTNESRLASRHRTVDCVNALVGVPNPAEFVRAARELAEACVDLVGAIDTRSVSKCMICNGTDQHVNGCVVGKAASAGMRMYCEAGVSWSVK